MNRNSIHIDEEAQYAPLSIANSQIQSWLTPPTYTEKNQKPIWICILEFITEQSTGIDAMKKKTLNPVWNFANMDKKKEKPLGWVFKNHI